MSVDEKQFLSYFVDKVCAGDSLLSLRHIPLKVGDPDNIFVRLKDGLIISAIVNLLMPSAVDMSSLCTLPKAATDEKLRNLETALAGARAAGLHFMVTPKDIMMGIKPATMALLWQLVWGYMVRCKYPSAGVNDTNPLSLETAVTGWLNSLSITGFSILFASPSADSQDGTLKSAELLSKLLDIIEARVPMPINSAYDSGDGQNLLHRALEYCNLQGFTYPASSFLSAPLFSTLCLELMCHFLQRKRNSRVDNPSISKSECFGDASNLLPTLSDVGGISADCGSSRSPRTGVVEGNLRCEIAELEKRLSELSNEAESRAATIARLESGMRDLQDREVGYLDDLQAKDEEIIKLQADLRKLSQLQAAESRASHDHQNLKAALDNLVAKESTYIGEISQLTAMLMNTEQNNRELEETLIDVRMRSAQDINNLKQQIHALELENDANKLSIASKRHLDGDPSVADTTNVSKLRKELDLIHATHSAVVAEMANTISVLQGKEKTLFDENCTLVREVTTLGQQVRESHASLDNTSSELAALKLKLQVNENRDSSQVLEIADLRSKVAGMEMTIVDLTKENRQYYAHMSEAEAKLAANLADKAHLDALIAENAHREAQLSIELTAARANESSLSTRNAKMKSTLTEIRQQRKDAQAESADRAKEIEKLQQLLTSAEDTISTLRAKELVANQNERVNFEALELQRAESKSWELQVKELSSVNSVIAARLQQLEDDLQYHRDRESVLRSEQSASELERQALLSEISNLEGEVRSMRSNYQFDNDSRDDQLGQLSVTISSLREDYANIQARCERLEFELSEAMSAHLSAASNVELLRSQLQAAEREKERDIADMQAALHQAKEGTTRLEVELLEAKAQVDVYAGKLQKVKTALANVMTKERILVEDLASREKELAEKRAALIDASLEVENLTISLDSKSVLLNAALAREELLLADLEKLQSRLHVLDSSYSDLSVSSSGLVTELRQKLIDTERVWETERSFFENELAKTKENASLNSANSIELIDDLQCQIAGLTSSLELSRKDFDEQILRYKDLTAEMDTRLKEIAVLFEICQVRDLDLAVAQGAKADSDLAISELQCKESKYIAEIAHLRLKIDEFDSLIADSKRYTVEREQVLLEAKTLYLNDIAALKEQLQCTIAEKMQDKVRLETEIADITDRSRQEAIRWTNDLAERSKRIEDLEAIIFNLREQNSQAQHELASSKSTEGSLRDELTKLRQDFARNLDDLSGQVAKSRMRELELGAVQSELTVKLKDAASRILELESDSWDDKARMDGVLASLRNEITELKSSKISETARADSLAMELSLRSNELSRQAVDLAESQAMVQTQITKLVKLKNLVTELRSKEKNSIVEATTYRTEIESLNVQLQNSAVLLQEQMRKLDDLVLEHRATICGLEATISEQAAMLRESNSRIRELQERCLNLQKEKDLDRANYQQSYLTEIESANRDIEELKGCIEQCKQRDSSQASTISTQTHEIHCLREEISNYECIVREKNAEIIALVCDRDKLQADDLVEIQRLRAESADLRSQLEALAEVSRRDSDVIDSLRIQIETSVNDRNTIALNFDKQIATLEEQLRSQRGQHDSEMASVKSQLSQQSIDFLSSSNNVVRLENVIARHIQEYDNLQQEYRRLTLVNVADRENMDAIEIHYKNALLRVQELESILSSRDAKIRSDDAQHKSEIAELVDTLENNKIIIKELEGGNSVLVTKCDSLQRQLVVEIGDLRSEVAEKDSLIEHLNSSLQKQREIIIEQRDKNGSLREDLDGRINRINELEISLKSTCEQYASQVDELKVSVVTCQLRDENQIGEIANLRSQLLGLEAALIEVEAQLSSAKSKNGDFEIQLTSLKLQLSNERNTCESTIAELSRKSLDAEAVLSASLHARNAKVAELELALQASNAELQLARSDGSNKAYLAQQQLDEFRAASKLMRQNNDELQRENHALTRRLREVESSNSNLETVIVGYKLDAQTARDHLQTMQLEKESEVERLQALLILREQDMRTQCVNFESDLHSRDNRISQLTSDLRSSKSTCEKQQRELVTNSTELMHWREKYDELLQFSTAEGELLKNDLAVSNGKVIDLEGERLTLLENMNQLSLQKSSHEETNSRLSVEVENLRQQLTEQVAQNHSAQAHFESILNKQSNRTQDEIVRLCRINNEAEEQIRNYMLTIEELNQQLSRVHDWKDNEGDCSEFEKEIHRLENELIESRDLATQEVEQIRIELVESLLREKELAALQYESSSQMDIMSSVITELECGRARDAEIIAGLKAEQLDQIQSLLLEESRFSEAVDQARIVSATQSSTIEQNILQIRDLSSANKVLQSTLAAKDAEIRALSDEIDDSRRAAAAERERFEDLILNLKSAVDSQEKANKLQEERILELKASERRTKELFLEFSEQVRHGAASRGSSPEKSRMPKAASIENSSFIDASLDDIQAELAQSRLREVQLTQELNSKQQLVDELRYLMTVEKSNAQAEILEQSETITKLKKQLIEGQFSGTRLTGGQSEVLDLRTSRDIKRTLSADVARGSPPKPGFTSAIEKGQIKVELSRLLTADSDPGTDNIDGRYSPGRSMAAAVGGIAAMPSEAELNETNADAGLVDCQAPIEQSDQKDGTKSGPGNWRTNRPAPINTGLTPKTIPKSEVGASRPPLAKSSPQSEVSTPHSLVDGIYQVTASTSEVQALRGTVDKLELYMLSMDSSATGTPSELTSSARSDAASSRSNFSYEPYGRKVDTPSTNSISHISPGAQQLQLKEAHDKIKKLESQLHNATIQLKWNRSQSNGFIELIQTKIAELHQYCGSENASISKEASPSSVKAAIFALEKKLIDIVETQHASSIAKATVAELESQLEFERLQSRKTIDNLKAKIDKLNRRFISRDTPNSPEKGSHTARLEEALENAYITVESMEATIQDLQDSLRATCDKLRSCQNEKKLLELKLVDKDRRIQSLIRSGPDMLSELHSVSSDEIRVSPKSAHNRELEIISQLNQELDELRHKLRIAEGKATAGLHLSQVEKLRNELQIGTSSTCAKESIKAADEFGSLTSSTMPSSESLQTLESRCSMVTSAETEVSSDSISVPRKESVKADKIDPPQSLLPLSTSQGIDNFHSVLVVVIIVYFIALYGALIGFLAIAYDAFEL